jgi:signal transduction histidine kinase
MTDTPLKILVIEDNVGDYILVSEYLQEAFAKATILHVDTLQKGLQTLEENPVDVILLDLTLPDGMGIESFHTIYEKATQTPIIILTGLGDTATALESLKVGAQDYIVKDDSSPTVLSKSIQYAIERSKILDHLKTAKEQLEQNNNDLRQFSYITSHNLRAPLSNVLGILKLIDTSTISDATTLLLLKNLEECTLQLNDTVKELLELLIIKNNENAQKEPLDLRKVFDRVVASIKTTIDSSSMKISADFDNAYEVNFNRTYLDSILLNLLTNAVKYSSPKRNPEIKVRTEKIDDGIRLYFADNGLGIDLTRYKDRVFGLYQRFHNHADSKGLGLYMVHSQLRVMGGDIELQSEVDKGTTFIITFKD